MPQLSISFLNEDLILLPEKAVYWPKEKMLMLSDLHLGKAIHFRSNGIVIPEESGSKDFITLESIIKRIKPQKVCFLGDLFHSSYNKEWEKFESLINRFLEVEFILVLGNHDILDNAVYQKSKLTITRKLLIEPFLLTHEPDDGKSNHYNIAGHIHPGIQLRGKGKLRAKIPCYYFGKKNAILPAFGVLTGLHILKPKKSDTFYGIVGPDVIPL